MALFTKSLQTVDFRNQAAGLRQILTQLNYIQDTLERQHASDEKRIAALEKKLKSATTQNGGA